MKLLVVAALVVVAAADRRGAGGQYGAPAGAPQSQYGSASLSSGYGLKSQRKPFESSLKPANTGYRQPPNAGYNQQSNAGYSSQSVGGYAQQKNGGHSQQPYKSYSQAEPTFPPQPYSFSYDVLDVRGNDFGAAEESNGEEVQGQYSVLLPDGRLQTVSYSVQGDSGFVADVEYEGQAKFFNADGEEEGRSTVKRGRAPTGGQGYGYSNGSGNRKQERY